MGSYISCKDDNGEYKTYKVPREIKRYILQLEHYILSPNKSKLKNAYPERFNKNTIE